MNNKNMYRRQALARRQAMPTELRQHASDKIAHQLNAYLLHMPDMQQAPKLIYRSLEDEVDTAKLFKSFIRSEAPEIYAPVTHAARQMTWQRVSTNTNWQRGRFGVWEPCDGDTWSAQDGAAVIFCPLVGFDRKGNRIGFGKGCFDRWLADHKDHILLKIGLAFGCQECPAIPVETHDIALDVIITENEVITCRNN